MSESAAPLMSSPPPAEGTASGLTPQLRTFYKSTTERRVKKAELVKVTDKTQLLLSVQSRFQSNVSGLRCAHVEELAEVKLLKHPC